MKLRGIAAGFVFCVGCGADVGSAEGELKEVPSEEVFCELRIGESTMADARAVLGSETDTTGTVMQQRLVYRYGAETEARFVMLVFGKSGLFEDAVVMGISYPECWRGGS